MSISNGEREKEAEKLVKKANKEISPSLLDFRLKPDWEAAAPLFEKAALMYKQAGNPEKAIETYERAALCQEKIGSSWHAAKHLEACGDICKLQGWFDRLASYYRQAADAYAQAGKLTTGADALAKGARALEENDRATAIQMLLEACDHYENEGKEVQGRDVFTLAISLMIKAKRYAEAAQHLARFAAACERAGSRNSQNKAYLGAIVCLLYGQDAAAAWHAFQDFMSVDAFMSSEEAFAADALFVAYRSQSPEEVKRVVESKASLFKALDNQVARLAVRLPTGDVEKLGEDIHHLMGGEEAEGDEGDEVL
eukprot:CAMPEP_0202893498 /NCGR_PEP_ID=MMETSP1392-20130828/3070_1 /ASSEMBLY_ACC=CAM_ASM_000868 /TAXON_ID=225041 /ORGANISM="Chlamydomonas chlamydogama, Strain SAG 11-48b" /LENGTH=310 /DNA_ID=CAMNT_0049577851 /DNA_START=30 /DNA_END=962 /DNA_ORIENTATION=-